MIKVILRLDCGTGMNSADSYIVADEVWEEYVNGTDINGRLTAYSWEAAVEFASGYGIYPISDCPEEFDGEEDEEDTYGNSFDQYSDDIEGWFELYNPDEHDGLKVGGGEWDWKEL